MPDRRSTAFQDLHQHISDFGSYRFLFYWVKETFRVVIVGSAEANAELNFSEMDISGSGKGAFKESFLGCLWTSSSSKLLSAGENRCSAKG